MQHRVFEPLAESIADAVSYRTGSSMVVLKKMYWPLSLGK